MKKVFLTLALVFATGTMMNATPTDVTSNVNEVLYFDCMEDAWDFGTKYG